MNCREALRADFSKCFKKCEGMDIISYNKEEIDSKMTGILSKVHKLLFISGFDKDPTFTKYVSRLSNQYDKYKETYDFPSKFEGKTIFPFNALYMIFFRF